MTDESSAQIRESRKDWVSEHREMYLKSGGVQGHIQDLTPVNGHDFGTHLLLKYKGRKTGRVLITPLSYADIGGEVVIVASKGGADTHPTWYLNLVEQDEVQYQIATQAFRGTWREPEGAERQKIWDFMADCFPFYADYQKSTSRIIPVVVMKGLEEISAFKFEEAEGWRDI
jgi:deazaflavin-dependent oxidoreductase (nitroreductase family)